MLWKPKWKKEALLTIKGANKFINFKKDLLDFTQIENIRTRQQDIKDSIANKEPKEVKKKCNLLEQECKKSLSSYVRPSSIAENTESIFVMVVIVLAIQAYYLKPFRIPTGSMQPTLNGINGHVLEKEKWPSLPQRIVQMGTHGRTYVNIVAKSDCSITGIKDGFVAKFFTKAVISFSDGSTQSFSASANSLKEIIALYQKNNPNHKGLYKAGDIIAQGFVDSGDLIFADKFSYHFRKPRRGEVFVFDTRGIDQIHKGKETIYAKDENGNFIKGPDGTPVIKDIKMIDQVGGSHYVKRCVGIPGDEISIDNNGNLIVNGKIASDRGLEYAQSLGYKRSPNFTGYELVQDSYENRLYENPLCSASDSISLKDSQHKHNAEYAAFGDNTSISLDSRYWGAVKQYNLVGPPLFTLWPFTHEVDPHWGLVK